MNVLSISSSISPCCWSNFDDFDDQVKPSPALKMWSHEGSNLYPKMAQCNGAKTGVLHGTLKKFLRPGQGVSILYKIQSTKINWKIKAILSGLVTRRLYFKKKWHEMAIFPVLQKLTNILVFADTRVQSVVAMCTECSFPLRSIEREI